MSKFTRREFLSASAATVGVATPPQCLRRRLRPRAVTPDGGSLFSVRHVVVLMQENRSFDHYFGTLRGVRGFDDPIANVQLHGCPRRYSSQPRSPGARSYGSPAFHLNGTSTTPCIADLDHSWAGTHEAWNRAAYDRWVMAKGAATMGYLGANQHSIHHALAGAQLSAIADQLCAISVMGPTKPDRRHHQVDDRPRRRRRRARSPTTARMALAGRHIRSACSRPA